VTWERLVECFGGGRRCGMTNYHIGLSGTVSAIFSEGFTETLGNGVYFQ